MKQTKPRQIIYEFMSEQSFPMSANDIFEHLQKQDITLSTLYRTLKAFVKNQILDKMENNDGIALYYIAKDAHSHYVECTKCHKMVKLDFCPYEKVQNKIKKESGFVICDDHIIYGVCKDCNKN